jgi:hypothetical protein
VIHLQAELRKEKRRFSTAALKKRQAGSRRTFVQLAVLIIFVAQVQLAVQARLGKGFRVAVDRWGEETSKNCEWGIFSQQGGDGEVKGRTHRDTAWIIMSG